MLVPESDYDVPRDGSQLSPEMSLSSPGRKTLDICGRFSGNLKRNATEASADIFKIYRLQ